MTKTRHFTRHQGTRGAHRFLLDHIRVVKLGTTLQQTQCNPLVNVILLPRCLLRSEAIERNALIRVGRPNDSTHVVLVLAEDLHITMEYHHDNAAGVMKRLPAPFPQNHRVHKQSASSVPTDQREEEEPTRTRRRERAAQNISYTASRDAASSRMQECERISQEHPTGTGVRWMKLFRECELCELCELCEEIDCQTAGQCHQDDRRSLLAICDARDHSTTMKEKRNAYLFTVALVAIPAKEP